MPLAARSAFVRWKTVAVTASGGPAGAPQLAPEPRKGPEALVTWTGTGLAAGAGLLTGAGAGAGADSAAGAGDVVETGAVPEVGSAATAGLATAELVLAMSAEAVPTVRATLRMAPRTKPT